MRPVQLRTSGIRSTHTSRLVIFSFFSNKVLMSPVLEESSNAAKGINVRVSGARFYEPIPVIYALVSCWHLNGLQSFYVLVVFCTMNGPPFSSWIHYFLHSKRAYIRKIFSHTASNLPPHLKSTTINHSTHIAGQKHQDSRDTLIRTHHPPQYQTPSSHHLFCYSRPLSTSQKPSIKVKLSSNQWVCLYNFKKKKGF